MVVKLSGGDSYTHGAVVQLGERLPCTEEVAGSSPVSSTNKKGELSLPFFYALRVGIVELFRVLLTK